MSGWWEELSQSLVSLLETHPLVVIGTVLFFEELGVPSPIPGDDLMMLAGVKARQGYYPLWAILLVQELVTVADTCGLYLFSRRYGRSLVQRYDWLLHLRPENLARAAAAIGRSGRRAIVVGRRRPGLRIATPIAAGVLGVPFRTFLPAIALGAFLISSSSPCRAPSSVRPRSPSSSRWPCRPARCCRSRRCSPSSSSSAGSSTSC